MTLKLVYEIGMPDELSAGIRGFTDEITITVESGDPGGESGEFASFMHDYLKEWYDGANVVLVSETP